MPPMSIYHQKWVAIMVSMFLFLGQGVEGWAQTAPSPSIQSENPQPTPITPTPATPPAPASGAAAPPLTSQTIVPDLRISDAAVVPLELQAKPVLALSGKATWD